MQKALKEEILQFDEKLKVQIEETHYAEHVKILMVEATDSFDMDVEKAEQIPTITKILH